MGDHDLTILYSTAHKAPESFRAGLLSQLYFNKKDNPLLEIHSSPQESSISNYYKDLLVAAKEIATPFIAIAEDDTLYPGDHFNYRPALDTFAYNMTRWNLYTWSDPPFFSLRQRKILATLIAPRELFIEAIEERFRVDPDGQRLQWWGEPGRNTHEKALGVTQRKSIEFNSYNPVVVFTHPKAFGYMGGNKRANKIRALSLPYWGAAEDVRKLYV